MLKGFEAPVNKIAAPLPLSLSVPSQRPMGGSVWATMFFERQWLYRSSSGGGLQAF